MFSFLCVATSTSQWRLPLGGGGVTDDNEGELGRERVCLGLLVKSNLIPFETESVGVGSYIFPFMTLLH